MQLTLSMAWNIRLYLCIFWAAFCFSRLEETIAKKEADHQDAVATMKMKHQTEIQKNKELFAASEAANTDLQKEVRGDQI